MIFINLINHIIFINLIIGDKKCPRLGIRAAGSKGYTRIYLTRVIADLLDKGKRRSTWSGYAQGLFGSVAGGGWGILELRAVDKALEGLRH